MKTIKLRSRAARMKSAAFFSSIGLPICTALWSSAWLSPVSEAEENVAPFKPSRPVLPPTTMIFKPGRIDLSM